MTLKTLDTYSADSITILEELEAVRKRPGMYIGSTDARGLHHLVWEIVDNAIDEALAGYGTEIIVTVKEDNSVIVQDFGRGVPIENHKSGKSAIEIIYTKLHAGGKFGQAGGYKVSGGLHGVGASVVNALSEFIEVTVARNGKLYKMLFEEGGRRVSDLVEVGESKKNGTTVWFKPDSNIFSTTVFNFQTLSERLRESAFLIKGLKVVLIDERSKQQETYIYHDGILSYIDFLNQQKQTIHDTVFFEGSSEDIEVEIAFQFTKSYTDQLYSFVNNVRTRDGGTHETGFKAAITKIFNEYALKSGLLKDKNKKLEGADIREGICAIISIRIPEYLLQFEGQTKNKLGTSEARTAVEQIVGEKMMYFFEENPTLSNTLIERAIKAQNVRDAARKAREEARMEKKSKKKEPLLSGKLAPAQSKDKNRTELYLVEGDSAGGSAKQARDRKYQAILPLRGKVINTEKARIEDVLKNEEINTIIHTIGAGLSSDFDLEKCNYNKIIIMTDADTDGAHIQVLILTFFFRYMRKLVEAGRIYIALPPLFKVTIKKRKVEEIAYAWNEDELQRLIEEHKNVSIQRFKGLGEMNADQLFDTTMNPQTRTLIKVNIDDLADAEKRIKILMGDQVEPRRDWIESNVIFTNEDNFTIKE
ncbi:MAG: DNA topoisomerase IV subunit B [Candidatus Izemoplasmataceae bacterium]|jgi:topoisomerase IV subunit B|uniref:DNA topoisomerase IV subunit B n=1 Tax=Liberiplasma polymorphum TaxID=3374570 RepID=UPI0037742E47